MCKRLRSQGMPISVIPRFGEVQYIKVCTPLKYLIDHTPLEDSGWRLLSQH